MLNAHPLAATPGSAVLEPSSAPERSRADAAQGDRLATLGLVTASVAHELASPVTALIANLGHALARLAEANASGRPPDPGVLRAIQGAVREALEAAERVRSISGELRSLARRRGDAGQTIVVARAIERALALARGEVLPRATIERRIALVPPVRGDEGRLVQVLINLLVNAAQAIVGGDRERNRVVVSTRTLGAGGVEIEIADTGAGIPPEVLPRIFDPFFTTKPHGLGLGLSVCRDIVQELGGELHVESAVGQGTIARVVLPGGC